MSYTRKLRSRTIQSAKEEIVKGVASVVENALNIPSSPAANSADASLQGQSTSHWGVVTQDTLDSLVRGREAQKSARKLLGKRKFANTLMVRVCQMRKSRKRNYCKEGDYVEVSCPADSPYYDFCELCAEALELDSGEETQMLELQIFRTDGTIVPNKNIFGQPWTIGQYMRIQNKNAAQMKLGIGFVDSFLGSYIKEKSQNDTSLSKSVQVLYAADLGPCGLDIGTTYSRAEVYALKSSDNVPLDYLPEDDSFRVVSISVDGTEILSCDSDGKFTVKEDKGGLLTIVHQTSGKISIKGTDCVPIYCVASGHDFECAYKWDCVDTTIRGNTPVMWIHKPGTYRCVVTSQWYSCSSKTIIVEKAKEVTTTSSARSTSSLLATRSKSRGSSLPTSEYQKSVDLTDSGNTDGHKKTKVFVDGSNMIYSNSELATATKTFADSGIIGTGGFGVVFQGKLRHCPVAVKRLTERGVSMLRGTVASQLQTEISALTRYRHPNLVPLMGYCLDPPCLVYPLMRRYSLFRNLHDEEFIKENPPIDWLQRANILKDAACGIVYLHGEKPAVIHHDINSSNILLDEHMSAKLADFGFSFQMPEQVGNVTLISAVHGLPGTNGYRPPEFSDSNFSVRSDVYSFGVVILETYTGLLAYTDKRTAKNLTDHTEDDRTTADGEKFMECSDPKAGDCSVEVKKRFLALINWSIKRVPAMRPSSEDVFTDLESIIDIIKREHV